MLAKVEVPSNPRVVEPKPPVDVPPPKPPMFLPVGPTAPKGDLSEEANAERPEDAKAEVDVAVPGERLANSAFFSGDLGDLKLLKGDAIDALAKPDDAGICAFGSCFVVGAILASVSKAADF